MYFMMIYVIPKKYIQDNLIEYEILYCFISIKVRYLMRTIFCIAMEFISSAHQFNVSPLVKL